MVQIRDRLIAASGAPFLAQPCPMHAIASCAARAGGKQLTNVSRSSRCRQCVFRYVRSWTQQTWHLPGPDASQSPNGTQCLPDAGNLRAHRSRMRGAGIGDVTHVDAPSATTSAAGAQRTGKRAAATVGARRQPVVSGTLRPFCLRTIASAISSDCS